MNDMSPVEERGAAAPVLPRSAVSHGVGWAGMAGLVAWTLLARHYGMDGPNAGLAAVFFCGFGMVLWSVLVDKVHRRASTGIAWHARPRPLSESLDISLVKLAGLWATWGAIAIGYGLARWYWEGNYRFAMSVFGYAAVPLFLASIPYVIWIDRRLVEPRDGAHALGQWLIGQATPQARAEIPNHLRSWLVKAFFLAFMLAIVPGNFADIVNWRGERPFGDPIALSRWLIALMFMIDVTFATVGYLLTMKPLDAHIRTANPYMQSWVAALICYPPFVLMNTGGPLDYHQGTADWAYWMQGHPGLLWITCLLLVALTGIYAWATVAFGLRFSNLTHRGILTHGPYRLSKHPAYLSKNLFWWLSTLPFLVTSGSIADMLRNSAIMAVVSGVYYWRALTEEKHLRSDPVYRDYAAWMAVHGPLPRLVNMLTGRRGTRPRPSQVASGEEEYPA